jgi:hypothetical protein
MALEYEIGNPVTELSMNRPGERPHWAMCGWLRAVKGLSTSQRWSEQLCVRPLSAAHRAAGHNASADQVPVKNSHSTMLGPVGLS